MGNGDEGFSGLVARYWRSLCNLFAFGRQIASAMGLFSVAPVRRDDHRDDQRQAGDVSVAGGEGYRDRPSAPPMTPHVVPSPSPLGLEAVRKAIADNLNSDVNIPDGHQGSAVVFANGEKIETAVATKVLKNDKFEWDVGTVVSHRWTGDHVNSFG